MHLTTVGLYCSKQPNARHWIVCSIVHYLIQVIVWVCSKVHCLKYLTALVCSVLHCLIHVIVCVFSTVHYLIHRSSWDNDKLTYTGSRQEDEERIWYLALYIYICVCVCVYVCVSLKNPVNLKFWQICSWSTFKLFNLTAINKLFENNLVQTFLTVIFQSVLSYN